MKQLEEPQRAEAEELRDALKRTHVEMREIQEQLERGERRRAPREREREEAPPRTRRRPSGDAHDFLHRCAELRAEIERTEIDLWELHERGKIGKAETHELAQILHALHRRTCEVEQGLHERVRAEEMEALHQGLREVHAQMEEIRKNMEDLKRGQAELREKHKVEVDKLRGQMNGLQKSTQQTNKLLQELLTMDSPATVGSAGQLWRY
jgi:hypothetical protein